MQIFFRSSKRKCGIKGSSSDELFDVKLSMLQDTNFLGNQQLRKSSLFLLCRDQDLWRCFWLCVELL